MSKDAREQAIKIMDKSKIGTLATIRDGKPNSRYMTFFHEDMILYTLTSKGTSKVDELLENPYAHILLGYEEGGIFNNDYIEVLGRVEQSDDQSLIDSLWSPFMNVVFKGKKDPNIQVLKIIPETITLHNKKNIDTVEIHLNAAKVNR